MTRPRDNARGARRPHGLRSGPVLLLAIGACGAVLSNATAGANGLAHAHPARVLSGNDNATLHLVHSTGSTLYEEGRASGSLPGTIHAWLRVGANFAGHFVFYTSSGTITGGGSAQSHQGHYPYVSFSGTAAIADGTSRYAHARGNLSYYGVLDRENDAVQIQTRGTLSY